MGFCGFERGRLVFELALRRGFAAGSRAFLAFAAPRAGLFTDFFAEPFFARARFFVFAFRFGDDSFCAPRLFVRCFAMCP